MKLLFLDTETTDLENPRLVQLCWNSSKEPSIYFTGHFKPPVPISIGAMATHHITNEMIEFCGPFSDYVEKDKLQSEILDSVLVCHNAKFDMKVLKNEGLTIGKHICTYQVARHLLESEQYSLQYLRYLLNLKVQGEAHSAEGDVRVLEYLFNFLFVKIEVDFDLHTKEEIYTKMIELTNKKVKMKSLNFGKYKGEDLYHVSMKDKQYLQWLNREETKKPNEEQNEDLVYTLSFYI